MIAKKIYVKNDFKAANTTFVKSKIWYDFLTMTLSNKAIKMKVKTATETILTFESPKKILGFYVTFHCKLLSPI